MKVNALERKSFVMIALKVSCTVDAANFLLILLYPL